MLREVRSSLSQMLYKIGVLKYFAKFTRKQLCCSLFFIKLQAGSPVTLSKRSPSTGLPVNIAKFLRALFVQSGKSMEPFCYLQFYASCNFKITQVY